MCFTLDDDGDVLAARPDRLWVLRRTVEQNVDAVTFPSLDVLEPQMGNQLVEVLQKIDTRTSHQVIEVPKIFPDNVPQRLVECRRPQMAEQLMEVPTVVSFSSLQQRTVEQVIDLPVPGRGGELGGLQGLHRGQSSTAFLEQIAESLDPGGGLQDFQPVQGSAASSSVFPGHAGEGFFRTFPRSKKVRLPPRVRV